MDRYTRKWVVNSIQEEECWTCGVRLIIVQFNGFGMAYIHQCRLWFLYSCDFLIKACHDVI